MNAPCFNCPDRCTGCHDTCEKYQAYKAHRQSISDARARRNYLDEYFSKTVKKAEKLRRQHA
jgi:hypothetical protein